MGKTKLEGRGRIVIPKKIREKLNLKPGVVLEVDIEDDRIVVRPQKSMAALEELKGCIKENKIDPMDAKRIWHM